MANFPPLKRYILFCIDQLIEQYHLSPPFLDVGCGIGDVSVHLAAKGWSGKAIDISTPAIEAASDLLQKFPLVQVRKQSLFDERQTFKTIFALDILEHLENDEEAFKKIADLLDHDGYLIAAIPSNPNEWRWDDDYFEHVRRYTVEKMNDKLKSVSLRSVVFWDFTYPVFWLMRRVYTWIKKTPPRNEANRQMRVEMCPFIQTWKFPIISTLLSRKSFIWNAIYKWQFRYFKNRPDLGHEMIALAQKNGKPYTPPRPVKISINYVSNSPEVSSS